jgi:hypothetical protein
MSCGGCVCSCFVVVGGGTVTNNSTILYYCYVKYLDS